MSDAPSPNIPPSGAGRPVPGNGAMALMRYDANKKSALIAYLLWFFLGWLGAHRFYLGRTGTAIAQLLIFLLSFPVLWVGIGAIGLLVVGIWVLVDAFLIPGMVRGYNNALINRLEA